MNNLLYIGQWQGFFSYGPEYGNIVEGKEVEFRLFIEEYVDGKFGGRIIDWEGIGANGEVSKVKGFINEDFISFVKYYDQSLILDEWGNEYIDTERAGHNVTYEGKFDSGTKSFSGSWEITVSEEHVGEFVIEELTTGLWRMERGS